MNSLVMDDICTQRTREQAVYSGQGHRTCMARGRRRHSLQITFVGTNCDARTCENLLMSTHASCIASALP